MIRPKTLLALILGILLGHMVGTQAAPVDYLISSGKLVYNDHELASGYVNIGPATSIYLHPENPRFHILQDLRDKDVQVILRVGSVEIERIQK